MVGGTILGLLKNNTFWASGLENVNHLEKQTQNIVHPTYRWTVSD